MSTFNAAAAGTFQLGRFTLARLGFGAMRITGKGVWGQPADKPEALRTLRALRGLGVNFIDTANSYGPDVSEELIAEALHPYGDDVLIATKGGLTRSGPDQWSPNGRPEHLIAEAKKSLQKLKVERLSLWQLHRIDPRVPRDETFGAVKKLLDDGLIELAGLSEVSVEEIKAAQRVFPVATVQNRYNLADRAAEDVVDYCTAQGIGFIPWYPLAAGNLAKPGGVVDVIAKKHKAQPAQIALAWVLQRSPVMLPIPGTSQQKHLEENVAAAHIVLDADDLQTLNRAR